VWQEATDELVRIEGHGLLSVVVAVILPVEETFPSSISRRRLFEIAMEEPMRCMSISRKRRNFNAVRACEMPEINSPTIFGRSVHHHPRYANFAVRLDRRRGSKGTRNQL
jgi:hypothetical protein